MTTKLYDWQEEYLKGLPQNVIMTADTGCFAKGTRVLMWDKTYKNIEDVVAGDRVVSTDDSGLMYEGIVEFMAYTSNQPKPMIEFTYGQKGKRTTITATYDHPFWDGEKYYPLYEFVWRKMAPYSRVQLQLLCEQYGTPFNYSPSRGLSYSDNPTSERQFWSLANSYEWENGKGASSSSTSMAGEPKEPTIHQPQGLRPDQQPYSQSGMVYPETKLSARMGERALNEIAKECSRRAYQVLRPGNYRNQTVLERAYRRHSDNRLAYQTKSIHGFSKLAPQYSSFGFAYNRTEAIDVSTASVLTAQPYYSIGIKNRHHTYVVENLPVHNTGKTLMALSHVIPNTPIVVIAPPAKVRSGDWESEALRLGLHVHDVVSFGKVARFATPTVPYILIVDEIHYAKSATSQRAKAIIRLTRNANCRQLIGLSATAIPNGFIDLQTYGILFGWWKNKTGFIREHVDRLKQLWQSVAFGLDKAHLNLPDLININTTINLTSGERDAYQVLKTERILDDGTLLDTPAKLHATLRQFLAPIRMEALEELFNSTAEHILVFYVYNVSRDCILEVAKKCKREIYEQSGHASNLPDGTPRNPSVTLLQYQSGSAGLNLQYAPISVFYDPSYSYQDTHQAKGRNHRGGQEKIVRHYFFKVAKTLDTAVYRCLETKKDFNDSMVAIDE
jgi:hypothetical protein